MKIGTGHNKSIGPGETMTETQRQFVAGHKWRTVVHLNCEDKGVLQQACKELGLTKLVVTPKTPSGKTGLGQWGVGKVSYLIDGNETEFESLEDALVAKGVT